MPSHISTLPTEDIPCYPLKEQQKAYFKSLFETLKKNIICSSDYSILCFGHQRQWRTLGVFTSRLLRANYG